MVFNPSPMLHLNKSADRATGFSSSSLSYSPKEVVSQNGVQGATNVLILHRVSLLAIANSTQRLFNPHEIAQLMIRYYGLMAKMRYFPSSFTKYPPHSPN
jgi:hypothetical protein